MRHPGISTGADRRERSLRILQEHFGKAGAYDFGIARGVDHRPVRTSRVRKSIGAENTFAEDLINYEPMREAPQPILDIVWRHCKAAGMRGRTVTLKAPGRATSEAYIIAPAGSDLNASPVLNPPSDEPYPRADGD